jgi:hypothetical protein
VTQFARALTCPSAQPDMESARIIGVVGGTPNEPEVGYLAPGVAVVPPTPDQLGGLEITHVLRFAATCEEHKCAHFSGNRCSLAKRIVDQLPAVVQMLPRCQIRSTCRWFAEQGADACRRCPQVVTLIPTGDTPLNRAAVACTCSTS